MNSKIEIEANMWELFFAPDFMYNFWIVNYNPWLTYLFSISFQTVHLYATDGTCIMYIVWGGDQIYQKN